MVLTHTQDLQDASVPLGYAWGILKAHLESLLDIPRPFQRLESCLVVSTPLKNISQLGWLFPYIMENKKCLKPPTRIILYSTTFQHCITRTFPFAPVSHCLVEVPRDIPGAAGVRAGSRLWKTWMGGQSEKMNLPSGKRLHNYGKFGY